MTARRKKGPLAYYKFRCRACALTFRAATREDDPDPACPNLECGAIQTPIGLDIAAGKAPGIGGNVMVKAMDYTANVVMSDFAMTDLASARQGESMAPKLPPEQQKRADAMFDPRKRSELFGGATLMGQMVNGMVAGAAGNANLAPRKGEIDGITAIHAARYTPPIHVITEGKKATK